MPFQLKMLDIERRLDAARKFKMGGRPRSNSGHKSLPDRYLLPLIRELLLLLNQALIWVRINCLDSFKHLLTSQYVTERYILSCNNITPGLKEMDQKVPGTKNYRCRRVTVHRYTLRLNTSRHLEWFNFAHEQRVPYQISRDRLLSNFWAVTST